MEKYNVVLLDDEVGNNQLLRHFIESYCPNLTIVAECKTVQSAYLEIIKHNDLIVFLDIELGNQENGFELLDLINKRKDQIIIVSAYPNYAIQAFRYETADFLMKPVKISELVDAVHRAIKRLNSEGFLKNDSDGENFPVQLYSKTQFINTEHIIYLEAEYSITKLVMRDGTILESTERIGELEQKLNKSTYFRVHKSFIVNFKAVSSIWNEGTNGFIEMKNGAKIPIARRRKKEILALMKA